MKRGHLLSYHIDYHGGPIEAREVHLTLSTALSRAKELEEADGISHVRLEVIYIHE